MSYTVTADVFRDVQAEVGTLHAAYYKEMVARSEMPRAEYAPRTEEFLRMGDIGEMVTYILRDESKVAVGFCNVYLANDMHNGELIAIEDTIYIIPNFRGGLGKAFGQCILEDLKPRGVKRFIITVLDVAGIADTCRKAGFRDIASQMEYTF